MNTNRINSLTEILGYSFNDPSLLQRALTHRSADGSHNETLEFLGDGILSAIVSSHLFESLPDASEGELTLKRIGIVNNHQALFSVAKHMNIGDFIVVDKGFVKSNKRAWQNLLANTVEALIGAVYLDGGMSAATEFFYRHFSSLLKDVNVVAHTNFKSLLQEFLQSQSQSVPRYETVEVQGRDHEPVFTVQCHIEMLRQPISGTGQTVKEAQQVAAGRAYELLCRRTD